MGDRWLKMQLQRNTMLSFAGKGTSEPTNSSLAQTASADAEFDLKLSLQDVRRALQAQILKSPTSMPYAVVLPGRWTFQNVSCRHRFSKSAL